MRRRLHTNSTSKLLFNAEQDIIEQIRAHFPQKTSSLLRLGIGDDCAILRPARGQDLLVTTDFTLEGRHFRRDTHPAFSVGHRTLARGLSDLAAMGAKPLAAFLSLALPADLPKTAAGRRWLSAFMEGIRTLADTATVTLAGGDTAQAPGPHILADIVLIGGAPSDTALRRSMARAGDYLYISGLIGGAAAELRTLLARPETMSTRLPRNPQASARTQTAHPHLFPQPRFVLGQALRRRSLATACIDLSDGLATDLTHLCEASSLCAEIESSTLPIHPLAQLFGRIDAQNLALHGGEDYELLFAAAPACRVPSRISGVPITRIGRLLNYSPGSPRISLLSPNDPPQQLEPTTPHHFRKA